MTMNSQVARTQHLQVPTPAAMAGRPIDHRGFPVPWFVTEKTDDGLWDFSEVTRERYAEAVRRQVCWVSGQPLGRFKAFCIGPMCAINRTAGDPPVTREIAEWSVKVCPFMSRPKARRVAEHRARGDVVDDPIAFEGISIARNPGVAAVWVSTNSEFQRGRGFYIGDPVEVTWWCEGRPATRAEVLASVESGIHFLEKAATEEGPDAVQELRRLQARAEPLWPRAAA